MDIGSIKTIQPKGMGQTGSSQSNSSNPSFSLHLLGSIGSGNPDVPVTESGGTSVSGDLMLLLNAVDLEGLGLSEEAINALQEIDALDLEEIAEIMGIDLSEIIDLHNELTIQIPNLDKELTTQIPNLDNELTTQSSKLTMEESDKGKNEPSLDTLGVMIHLMQERLWKRTLPSEHLKQFKDLLKISKVIDLLSNQIDMHHKEAQKVFELKDLLHKTEMTMTAVTDKAPKWDGIVRAAYYRGTQPEAPAEMKPSEGSKPLQTILGAQQFTLPRTESFSINLAVDDGHLRTEQFVKELQKILGKSQMQTQPNMSKLLIKLYPEQLGSLRIELLQQNGVMTAKILAATSTAKELIDSQLQGLKHAFNAQNIQVDKIEVSQAISDPDRQNKGQSQQQSNDQPEHRHQESSKDDEGDVPTSFREYFMNPEGDVPE
ncbi:flagellar hook-length control protein FliK [Rossellomorea aquimaris]|uniref:flagellar hook-length control protein FliK n=1 Tax=Rossellomorea aquimaris TaxID=189382 RepID=UPI001CD2DB02|nr:flagellar hook-length control protein FliK [Rossellomorea aquimaris]MCA1053514.1 flagellar hook-length control protein FliK [Rossellomorea aquimaris]